MLKGHFASGNFLRIVSLLGDNHLSPSCRIIRNRHRRISNHFSSSTTISSTKPADSPLRSKSEARGELRSWQIHAYSGIDDLQASTSRIPPIKSPTDVLIRVHASSINPIDIAMTRGYGSDTLNLLRGLCSSEQSKGPFGLPSLKQLSLPFRRGGATIEFPLTLGRDFSGVIVQMGHEARGKHGLRVGDEVFGVVGVQRQGAHATYVISSIDTIRRKPKNMSFLEAAAIPYVGLTTWAAIRVTGAFSNLNGKRFLVLGGSGGVGTFAVQYLKSQGAHVVTTCSSDAEALMTSLGCDFVIDYKMQEFSEMVKHYSPYDCVLDLSGPTNYTKSLETIQFLKAVTGQYITLSPPFLSNMDKFGLLGGAAKNVGDLLNSNYQSWNKGQSVTKWAFFIPNGAPLEDFTDLLQSQRIRPVIHESFKFDETKDAYKRVDDGHLRGKIMLDMAQPINSI